MTTIFTPVASVNCALQDTIYTMYYSMENVCQSCLNDTTLKGFNGVALLFPVNLC